MTAHMSCPYVIVGIWRGGATTYGIVYERCCAEIERGGLMLVITKREYRRHLERHNADRFYNRRSRMAKAHRGRASDKKEGWPALVLE